MNASALGREAAAVLDRNWTGTGTLPSPAQYPHQWSWDSAFIAIGWAHVDPSRARHELLALFEGQWADGRVPHIKFDPELHEDAYFPGPGFWASRRMPGAPAAATSGLVQPPVHARATWQVYQRDSESDATMAFLATMYPKLCAWHDYLTRCRNVGGTGLVAIVHPWESGTDNSPLWDAPLSRLGDGPAGIPFVRRDITNVAPAQRPSDRDYRRYVQLAAAYRDVGYDDGRLGHHAFVVEDPMFNAVLIDAELSLARIAKVLGVDAERHTASARRLSEALNHHLWYDDDGRFGARDVVTGQRLREHTVASLVPLLDPWLPRPRRAVTIAAARSRAFTRGCSFPLPSVAVDSPRFDRRRYWRGPMWASTNWLVALGAQLAEDPELARAIARGTLDAVAREGFREYFDPVSGAGLGAHEFSWTAALTLDFLSTYSDGHLPATAGDGA